MNDERMRASDADRDAIVQVLNTAYGSGRITAEEHEERVDAALAARTFGDLRPLTLDLVPSAAPGPRPQPFSGPRTARWPGRGPSTQTTSRPDPQVFNVSFDRIRQAGGWRVPARMRINGFLATVELDLTQAELPGPVIDIDVNLIMTTLRLRVPAGSNVQDKTSRILGDQSIRRIGRFDDRAPLILLTGTVALSEVKIRGPRGQHGLFGVLGR